MRKNKGPNYKALFYILLLICLAYLASAGIGSLKDSAKKNTVTLRTSQYTTQPRLSYTATSKPSYQYIGNRRSHVFHRPTCSSVKQMNNSNKVYLESREAAIQKDYTPCGRCHL
jgi:hypothetical protein